MKARMKAALSLALALALLLPLTGQMAVVPASAATQDQIDALRQDASDLDAQKAEIQAQLEAVQADKSQALEQKRLLEEQIEVIQAEIDNMDAQILAYDELISQKTPSWSRRRPRSRSSMNCSAAGCGRWRSREKSPTGRSCFPPPIFPICWTIL